MNNFSVVMSILGKLLCIVAVLGFVAFMVVHTGKLACLWLLWLLLIVDCIPAYNLDFETKEEKITKETRDK